MDTFQRAQCDTGEGLASIIADNMNKFGGLLSGHSALGHIKTYPHRAERLLTRIDEHMTPLLLRFAEPQSNLELWSSRYQDCSIRLDRLKTLIKQQSTQTTGWDETLAALACTEATIEGALQTLALYGIEIHAVPRLPKNP